MKQFTTLYRQGKKALAEKEGRVYVNPHLKMMLEEAEYVLKGKCEAENLNFDDEWVNLNKFDLYKLK